MKKKIINGFLMAALMLTATTSFVSCKDNVDDEMVGVYNNLAQQKTALEKKISDLETDLNAKIKANSDEISKVKEEIKGLKEDLAAIDVRLNQAEADIKQLQEEMKSLTERVSALEEDINFLVDNLINTFTVDHTVNHVIGSINMPGVNVLSLAAFYGDNVTEIKEFPTAEKDYIVDQENGATITTSDIYGADKCTFTETITQPTANAGKLFFTARVYGDQSKFNINDYKLTLMNSVGRVAPVTFSNVKLSTYQVQWGFYKSQEIYTMEDEVPTKDDWFEADATIAAKDLDVNKFNIKKFIDFDGMKEDIKAAWKEIKEGRPYATKDEAIKTIGRAAAKILINFYSGKMSSNNTDTKNMSYSPQKLVLSKVTEDGTEHIMAQSELNIAATAVAPMSYKQFWAYEEDAVVPEDKLADVEKVITKVGQKIGATKFAEQANKYLEKAANYIVKKVNAHQLTRAISPCILYYGKDGVNRLTSGTTLEQPGTMEIMMTSPTEELLAPAYRKYIAVTDAVSGKVYQQATLPGSNQYWTLDFPKAGKTYKVVLSCVDYYGFIVNKVYVVSVL